MKQVAGTHQAIFCPLIIGMLATVAQQRRA